jgi:hypothetical protein
MMNQLYHQFS